MALRTKIVRGFALVLLSVGIVGLIGVCGLWKVSVAANRAEAGSRLLALAWDCRLHGKGLTLASEAARTTKQTAALA